jgi:transposase
MALADQHGLPLSICIASGSRHDVALVDRTLDEAFCEHLPSLLIGDKAFDSAKLAQSLCNERNVTLVAPKRRGSNKRRDSNKRSQDGRTLRRYKRRWKVERLFSWLKKFRRLVTRWETKASNFLGFLELGCIVILIRHLLSR